MKISDIKIYTAKEWRTFLFVVVETDNGLYGLGESGITSRELAVAGMIEHLKPLVIGESPFRTEHIWQKLWRGGFYPSGQILSAAIAAIDIALWDIKGKALNTPVYDLLGGKCRDKVMTYNHLHSGTTEQVVDGCKRAIDDGWKCVRWEFSPEYDNVIVPHKAIPRAIEQWHNIRKILGDDIELCFDAHTKINLSDAVRFCKGIEECRPFFVEDAIRSENPDVYQQLRQQTSVPLAAGEQYGTKWDFKTVVEQQLIDHARIDLCIGGGITEAKKVAAICETHYVDIAVHNPVGPVSSAACFHFNLSIPNMSVMEMPKRPGDTMADVFKSHFHWEDGYLIPSDAPGLGIEFNSENINNYPFEITELPHLQKIDGSFSNW